MYSVLSTASLRVSDILANPFRFAIPSYQRPFSWTIKEAGQLLEDLSAAAGIGQSEAAEQDYFLGAILLLDASGSELPVDQRGGAQRAVEIVDGQQRLVTLTILAAVLRDLLADPANPTWRHLDSLVIEGSGGADAHTSPLRLKLHGREQGFFETYVQSRGGCAKKPAIEEFGPGEQGILAVRERYMAELSALAADERLMLADYFCDRCHFVVILTGNIDRAHRMFTVLNERGRPLQRNDILKADLISGLPSAKASAAVVVWDRACDLLGAEVEAFFGHLRTIYGHTKHQIIAAVRSVIRESGGAGPFLTEVLSPFAEAYHLVLGAKDLDVPIESEVRRPLIFLSRLSAADWVPAVMLALKMHRDDPGRAALLIREIERFAYLLRLLTLGAGKRVRRFAGVIEAIKSRTEIVPGEWPFRISREEARGIAYYLKDIHGRNPAVCKLLLLRLNDELTGTTTMLDPADYSVEHVLPQRPNAAGEWRQWFPLSEEREAATASLGNLVIVTQPQNDKARNQSFARKQEIYRAAGDGQPILAITRDAVEAKVWRAAEIRAREAKLLALIEGMWRIDLGAQSRQSESWSARVFGRGGQSRRA